ncbi:MAG: bifunctional phosphoribosyl-AMP cyclohydrolase/phosphoribosyl-ATP diphosphatase HisIE [Gemmatimonadetes bacterium]|nr:bifunctional phosphoribosyl-AMP cyclohydrolase/phosphoribosyl-ATP diphosphatase HisIE [Gemmatimonadota bacterium]
MTLPPEDRRPTDRRIRDGADLDALSFDGKGLVPVVVQDASTGRLLMLAWANRMALETTLATGAMHFWSRSRGALWRKGETSGNTQALVSLHADCDGDTVIALVTPAGPACHTGEETCFGLDAYPASVLDELSGVIRARARERPEGSYTTRLLGDENLRLKKLGEEVAELISALARKDAGISAEAADLVYHLLVALEGAGVGWGEVERELERRRS